MKVTRDVTANNMTLYKVNVVQFKPTASKNVIRNRLVDLESMNIDSKIIARENASLILATNKEFELRLSTAEKRIAELESTVKNYDTAITDLKKQIQTLNDKLNAEVVIEPAK